MKRSLLLIILGILFFGACSDSKSKNNPEKTPNQKELRIISLASSISDELVELGLKKNIVGATSYCKVAQENKDLIIGSAIEINEEKILLLKPDMVFTTALTKQSTLEILKNNGIKTHMYKKASSFDAICENHLEMSKLVGKETLAKSIIKDAKFKIDSLKLIIPEQTELPKVFFQLGANPIATVIPKTYMNDFILISGGKNLFYDLDKYIVNRESVLLRNPDYIFITSMGIVGEEEKKNWMKYEDVSAVKNNKIFLIDSGIASSPTVTNFVKTIEIMVKNMYF